MNLGTEAIAGGGRTYSGGSSKEEFGAETAEIGAMRGSGGLLWCAVRPRHGEFEGRDCGGDGGAEECLE